jgi:hypothetical protein
LGGSIGKALFWIAVAVVILAFLWFVPQFQGQYFSQGVPKKEVPALVNEYRRTWAQILGGAALLLGIYFTWRGQQHAREAQEESQKNTQEQLDLTRRGQMTERFTQAIEQLGSKELEIRLGGIYSLERTAHEEQNYHWPIMEVLTSYVRRHAARKPEKESGFPAPPQPDIQAILDVIGRRSEHHRTDKRIEYGKIDLNNTDLRRASLEKACLKEASLWGASLQRAYLGRADLREAYLVDTNFQNAYLGATNFEGANLKGANLKGADLRATIDLTAEQLDQAFGDQNTQLPDGLKRPASWSQKS